MLTMGVFCYSSAINSTMYILLFSNPHHSKEQKGKKKKGKKSDIIKQKHQRGK